MKIQVSTDPAEYELVFGPMIDGVAEATAHCLHVAAIVEPPCCRPGANGLVECACQGNYEVICFNPDCDGINERDALKIMSETMETAA